MPNLKNYDFSQFIPIVSKFFGPHGIHWKNMTTFVSEKLDFFKRQDRYAERNTLDYLISVWYGINILGGKIHEN